MYSLVTHKQDVPDVDFRALCKVRMCVSQKYTCVIDLCLTPVLMDPCTQDVDVVLQWCGQSLLEHLGSRAEPGRRVFPTCPKHKDKRLGGSVVASSMVSMETVRELLLHHALQLRCNAHAVTAIVGGDRDGESPVHCVEQTKLGSALFVSASLLNHSCDPNTIVRCGSITHTHSSKLLLHCVTQAYLCMRS